MKDEDKTKAELIKKLKTLRKERGKSTLNDLTEHKQTEQVIQESESRFRELFNYMSSGVAIYEAKNNGRDFIFRSFNRAAEKIDKVKKGDIVGKSVLKVFPGVKDFGLFKIFQEVYKTGKPQRHPISLYKDQRITGWRENYVYKLPSGEIAAIYDDITERKQVEEELKNSEERLKILFDYAPDAYYISDLKGNFIDGNIAAERVIGYKREELIGKNFLKLKLLSLTDIPKAAKTLAKSIIGKPTGPDEFVLNRKDNSKITVEISTYPIKITGRTLVLGIARDITERKQAEEGLKKTMDATIETVSKIVEVKDPYTAGHQQRVSQLATAIAKELNLSPDKVEGIRIASLIHDIGKISVPTEILSKPTALSDIEFSLIKGHSQIGYDILKSIDFPWPVEEIVLQHHERLNGSGYPQGLKADKIMTEAKIIGLADVVEAMSSHRPYRPALGIDAALEGISKNRGILYDPEVVDACLKLFKKKGFKFKEGIYK